MIYLLAYGHKVMASKDHASLKVVFNNLVGRNVLANPAEKDEGIARANYYAWMTVELGVYVGGGTPLALMRNSEVIDRGTAPNAGPPLFSSPQANLKAMTASQARQNGVTEWVEASKDKAEQFASRFGWLEASPNKAADAMDVERSLMGNLEAVL